jgi:PIN domain nuclease of toxin-antitoxin system
MGGEPVIVLDTHVLLWWLSDPKRLSAAARRRIASATGERKIAISSISILEIATLVRRERLRLAIEVDRWLAALRSLPELLIEPVTADIALAAGNFGLELPGDAADRIIAATAQALNATLISADDRLRAAAPTPAIW